MLAWTRPTLLLLLVIAGVVECRELQVSLQDAHIPNMFGDKAGTILEVGSQG